MQGFTYAPALLWPKTIFLWPSSHYQMCFLIVGKGGGLLECWRQMSSHAYLYRGWTFGAAIWPSINVTKLSICIVVFYWPHSSKIVICAIFISGLCPVVFDVFRWLYGLFQNAKVCVHTYLFTIQYGRLGLGVKMTDHYSEGYGFETQWHCSFENFNYFWCFILYVSSNASIFCLHYFFSQIFDHFSFCSLIILKFHFFRRFGFTANFVDSHEPNTCSLYCLLYCSRCVCCRFSVVVVEKHSLRSVLHWIQTPIRLTFRHSCL